MSSAAEQHLKAVHELRCVVRAGSHAGPIHAHHCLTGGHRKEARNHFNAAALCWNHHQGPQGIHTLGRKKFQEQYGDELELIRRTRQACQCKACIEYRLNPPAQE